MDKIKWCFDKRLKLIEPNKNLSNEYLKNAEETLLVLNKTKETGSNMWLATQKYYTLYFAAYSILMKLGIKSEIHSCTIEVIKFLEINKFLNINLSKILDKSKDLRIDNQYYLKNIPIKVNSNNLSNLLLDIREYIETLESDKIRDIRDKMRSINNDNSKY